MRAVLAEDQMPEVVRRSLIDPEALGPMQARLGAGAFGEVWRATYNGTPVAVKKLHNKLDAANLEAFKAECELQLSLRHPNLVQLMGGAGATTTPTSTCAPSSSCARRAR